MKTLINHLTIHEKSTIEKLIQRGFSREQIDMAEIAGVIEYKGWDASMVYLSNESRPVAQLMTTVIHPECKDLRVDIYQLGDYFYFDENGDWYDHDWCMSPLEDCMKDATAHLNEKYTVSSHHRTEMEISEEQYRGYF